MGPPDPSCMQGEEQLGQEGSSKRQRLFVARQVRLSLDSVFAGANILVLQACDNCRKKKARCNEDFPCSSCRASGIECKFSERKATK
jgi:hypothetical protein